MSGKIIQFPSPSEGEKQSPTELNDEHLLADVIHLDEVDMPTRLDIKHFYDQHKGVVSEANDFIRSSVKEFLTDETQWSGEITPNMLTFRDIAFSMIDSIELAEPEYLSAFRLHELLARTADQKAAIGLESIYVQTYTLHRELIQRVVGTIPVINASGMDECEDWKSRVRSLANVFDENESYQSHARELLLGTARFANTNYHRVVRPERFAHTAAIEMVELFVRTKSKKGDRGAEEIGYAMHVGNLLWLVDQTGKGVQERELGRILASTTGFTARQMAAFRRDYNLLGETQLPPDAS